MLPISISVAKSCETPVTHFGKEVLLLLSVVELCGSDMLSIGIEQGLSIYCIDIIINTMLTLNIARIRQCRYCAAIILSTLNFLNSWISDDKIG